MLLQSDLVKSEFFSLQCKQTNQCKIYNDIVSHLLLYFVNRFCHIIIHTILIHFVLNRYPYLIFYLMKREHEQNFITCTHDRFITIIVFTDGGGGVGKFSNANIFFVSVFPQKLFFTCIQLILFQCLQPLHTNYFKIFQPTPSPPHLIKTIMVCP